MPYPLPQVPRSTTDFSVFDDSGYDTSTTLNDEDIVTRDVTPVPLGDTDNTSEWAADQMSSIVDAIPVPDVSLSDILFDPNRPGSTGSSDYEDFIVRLGCRRWPMGICTMPRLNSSKGKGPGKLHPRPSLKSFYSGSSAKQSTGSLRSPDRFLASADNLDASVQKFRMNKDAVKLSPAERILRNDDASPDAFSARRSFTTPAPPAIGNRRSSSSARPGGEHNSFPSAVFG